MIMQNNERKNMQVNVESIFKMLAQRVDNN